MAPLGKALFIFGLIIAGLGVALWALSAVPFVGRLPGDIYIRRGGFTFYFPLATCILVSIIVSLILFALMRR